MEKKNNKKVIRVNDILDKLEVTAKKNGLKLGPSSQEIRERNFEFDIGSEEIKNFKYSQEYIYKILRNQIESHEEQLTSMAKMLAKHEYDMQNFEEKCATKDDFRELQKTLDKFLGMMMKRDQEVTLLQYRTQQNTEDIKQIKTFVHFT